MANKTQIKNAQMRLEGATNRVELKPWIPSVGGSEVEHSINLGAAHSNDLTAGNSTEA